MSRAFRHCDHSQEILCAQVSRDRWSRILLGEALLGAAGAGASLEGRHLLGEVGVSYADAAGHADRIRLAVVDHGGVRTVRHFYTLGRAAGVWEWWSNGTLPPKTLPADSLCASAFIVDEY